MKCSPENVMRPVAINPVLETSDKMHLVWPQSALNAGLSIFKCKSLHPGRFADFLTENGALEQAKTVINVILQGLWILEQHPLSGRHYTPDGVFRKYSSSNGSSGYACLYSFDESQNVVVIHAPGHQREIGYSI